MKKALIIFHSSSRSLFKSSGNEKQQLNRKLNVFCYALTEILYKFIENFVENFMNVLDEAWRGVGSKFETAAVQTVPRETFPSTHLSIFSYGKCSILGGSLKYYSWIKHRDVNLKMNTELDGKFVFPGRMLSKTAFTKCSGRQPFVTHSGRQQKSILILKWNYSWHIWNTVHGTQVADRWPSGRVILILK